MGGHGVTARDDRLRARLGPLAVDVRAWKDALDAVSPRCTCTLSTEPGYTAVDNATCPASTRRCRSMVVLTVRTHMGMNRIPTRALAAADIPRMVQDLADLLAGLDDVTDWIAFGTRLQATIRTGRDPDRPSPPADPAEGAPPA